MQPYRDRRYPCEGFDDSKGAARAPGNLMPWGVQTSILHALLWSFWNSPMLHMANLWYFAIRCSLSLAPRVHVIPP